MKEIHDNHASGGRKENVLSQFAVEHRVFPLSVVLFLPSLKFTKPKCAQISDEEQNSQMAKVQEALEKVGGKSILICTSAWSSEQWLGFGVGEFPDVVAHPPPRRS